ncbi:unnamed protein product [Paramecium sonneborni]|uniref:Uncharacterized protein n=1 Tax=Paramecium sonneborni TaxID=65129 RepID=A0A8S1N244_9CILI|nr:unnamed protein product [Paramecium sonneborni]
MTEQYPLNQPQYQDKNRNQYQKNQNQTNSNLNYSYYKQSSNFRQPFNKNQNHDRQTNLNYSYNYNNNRRNNYRYSQKQRDYHYQTQPESIYYDQKISIQSENQNKQLQTNEELTQLIDQGNRDSQFQNQIQIDNQYIQNSKLQEINISDKAQVSSDTQEQINKQTLQSQLQISTSIVQTQDQGTQENQKSQNNEKVQSISKLNTEKNVSLQNNQNQETLCIQQQLIQQKQIPLLVQFLILPNDTTSEPQLIPLTLQNLTQIYEQLKQLIQHDQQQN